MGSKPLVPPFSEDTALLKVRLAENLWNSREPELVAGAYSPDTRWRNRTDFLEGREAVKAFLVKKWEREHEYRLIKELWAYQRNRIAVRFAYEWNNGEDQWFRSYGNENWEFAPDGLMRLRIASINDLPIKEGDRLFLWTQGIRPDGYKGLSELGL